MAPVTDASQGKVQVFDPQEIVRGETIAQWTENWWQWAFQAPANGPLGYPAPQPTHGKIFFIGANEGPNAPPVHATINVPTGVPILLPMINAFDTEGPGIESDPGFKGSFADEAKFVTRLDQAAITNAFVTITKNGRTLLKSTIAAPWSEHLFRRAEWPVRDRRAATGQPDCKSARWR